MNASIETLDIHSLTTKEKLTLMDRLWNELSKRPEEIEVPKWHLEILRDRELALANGEDEFIELDVAMKQIRDGIDRGKSSR